MNAVLEKPARKARMSKAAPAPMASEPVATEERAPDVITVTPSAVPSKQLSQKLLKKLYWEAFVCMDNAYSVLSHYAAHVDDTTVLALRDLLEMYLTKARPRCDDDGDQQDHLFNLFADLSKIHALVGPSATNNDDGVLHGVDQLLTCAMRIADEDAGVLDD